MWLFVLFDLPTDTRQDRKAAQLFRENLKKQGFDMFNYSVYIRHAMSYEVAQKYQRRVRKILPKYGKITMLMLTDKQFGDIEIYENMAPQKPPEGGDQLMIF